MEKNKNDYENITSLKNEEYVNISTLFAYKVQLWKRIVGVKLIDYKNLIL